MIIIKLEDSLVWNKCYLKAVDSLLIHALVNISHLLCESFEELLEGKKKSCVRLLTPFITTKVDGIICENHIQRPSSLNIWFGHNFNYRHQFGTWKMHFRSFSLWHTLCPEEIGLERSDLGGSQAVFIWRHSVRLDRKEKNLQMTWHPSKGQQNVFFSKWLSTLRTLFSMLSFSEFGAW